VNQGNIGQDSSEDGHAVVVIVSLEVHMKQLITPRSNAPAISPCEYFQRNVAIPFLDHISMFIDQQFSDLSTIKCC